MKRLKRFLCMEYQRILFPVALMVIGYVILVSQTLLWNESNGGIRRFIMMGGVIGQTSLLQLSCIMIKSSIVAYGFLFLLEDMQQIRDSMMQRMESFRMWYKGVQEMVFCVSLFIFIMIGAGECIAAKACGYQPLPAIQECALILLEYLSVRRIGLITQCFMAFSFNGVLLTLSAISLLNLLMYAGLILAGHDTFSVWLLWEDTAGYAHPVTFSLALNGCATAAYWMIVRFRNKNQKHSVG